MPNTSETAGSTLPPKGRISGYLPPELSKKLNTQEMGAIEDVTGGARFQEQSRELHTIFPLPTQNAGLRVLKILIRDSESRWKTAAELERRMFAAFGLLRDAHEQKCKLGALPTQLLIPTGENDPLSTHLRWRLLKGFFPGEVASQSPREAEDLSFAADCGPEPPAGGREPAAPWVPAATSLTFKDHFQSLSILGEYTSVVCELMLKSARGPQSRILEQQSLNTYRTQLSEPPPGGWRNLLEPTAVLSVKEYGDWMAEVVRLVDPSCALAAIGNRDALLDHAPHPLHEPIPVVETQATDRARELLRRVLRRRDGFALTLTSDLLMGSDGKRAIAGGWLDLWGGLTHDNPLLRGWIRAHADHLFRPPAIPVLFPMPHQDLRNELMRFFSNASDADLTSFLEAAGRHSNPAVIRFLVLGAESEVAEVRAVVIEALGRHADPQALRVLENLLDQNNSFPNREEVAAICAAIAAREEPEAGMFLQRVAKERTTLRYRWRRPIRAGARAALQHRRRVEKSKP